MRNGETALHHFIWVARELSSTPTAIVMMYNRLVTVNKYTVNLTVSTVTWQNQLGKTQVSIDKPPTKTVESSYVNYVSAHEFGWAQYR
jgi:hypothetical protein